MGDKMVKPELLTETLLDKFAMQAMGVYLAQAFIIRDGENPFNECENIASYSYRVARAMIEVRQDMYNLPYLEMEINGAIHPLAELAKTGEVYENHKLCTNCGIAPVIGNCLTCKNCTGLLTGLPWD